MASDIEYSFDERRDFAMWAHARVCFENCANGCKYVLEEGLAPHTLLYKPITTWALIEYCKPFKRSRGLDRVPLEIVNPKWIPLHNRTLSVRDKVLVHIDMDGETREFDTEPIHDVHVQVTSDDVIILASEPKIPPGMIEQLATLSCELRSKASYYLTKHTKRIYTRIKRRGRGVYQIDVRGETSEWVTKRPSDGSDMIFWD